MKKSPKQMQARFAGKCSCCNRKVDAGEQITWIKRGVIECQDCTPIGQYTDTDTDTATTSGYQSNAWDKAFTWDNGKPTPKPDSQYFPVSKPKPTPKPAPKPIQAPKPQPKPAQPIETKKAAPKPIPTQSDAQTATVCDLLVTLINAAGRLNPNQCESIRQFAETQAQTSSNELRRNLFAQAASALN